MPSLPKTFKPFIHLIQDIPRTLTPYGVKKDGFGEDDGFKFTWGFTQVYRDGSIWGDLAQPFRGLINMAKGLGRIARGVGTLFPPAFFAICGYKIYVNPNLKYVACNDTSDVGNVGVDHIASFWLAIQGEGKKLLYDLTNGLGILLRGALQVITTPLTYLFRIPLRLAITEGVKNQHKYSEYNTHTVNGQTNKLNGFVHNNKSPFSRIVGDFKGTLAAYKYQGGRVILSLLWNFIQPFRGMWNVLKGVVTLPISLVRAIFLPLELLIRCVGFDHKVDTVLYEEEGNKVGGALTWLSLSSGVLLHGMLQILTTPLQWLIRMPLRGIISYHVSQRVSLESEDKSSVYDPIQQQINTTDEQNKENVPIGNSYNAPLHKNLGNTTKGTDSNFSVTADYTGSNNSLMPLT